MGVSLCPYPQVFLTIDNSFSRDCVVHIFVSFILLSFVMKYFALCRFISLRLLFFFKLGSCWSPFRINVSEQNPLL